MYSIFFSLFETSRNGTSQTGQAPPPPALNTLVIFSMGELGSRITTILKTNSSFKYHCIMQTGNGDKVIR